MSLVDPAVSRRKLERELKAWDRQAATYRSRGYLIVGRDDLTVDVGFLARLPIGGQNALPGMAACVRLDFSDYDLRSPSAVFVDYFSGEPIGPHVRALDFRSGVRNLMGLPPDLLLNGHPETRLPFLCHIGVREYHTHPEHDGDDWLLYRDQPFGTLDAICDLIWSTMSRSVVGIRTDVQMLPPPLAGMQLQIALLQGDVDAQAAALTPASAPFPPAA
jgi:hypothetical protein